MVERRRPARDGGLLETGAAAAGGELTQRLAVSGAVEIQRIVSHGERSPDGFWYDQERAEWVVVVSGHARLRLAGPERTVELGPGDWIDLPAHCRHRVEWTDPDAPTVWLAVFYPEPERG